MAQYFVRRQRWGSRLGRALTTKGTKGHEGVRLGRAWLPNLPLLSLVLAWLTLTTLAAQGVDPIVDNLKAKLATTNIGDRPKLCLQIAEHQMTETSKQYAASEDEKAQPALTDVVAYSELARDYSIQSHKHQKQTEIAVRGMTRKLGEILHSLGREEQPPVRDALTRLQKVRDDLLAAMFSKGAK